MGQRPFWMVSLKKLPRKLTVRPLSPLLLSIILKILATDVRNENKR